MNRLRFYTHRLTMALLCASALFLTSCTTEDPEEFYKVGMGTLIEEQSKHTPYSILLDEEETPFVVTNSEMLTDKGMTKEGQRVLASYHVMDKRNNRTFIQLREIFSVLTKPMVRPTNKDEVERLGNDPVRIVYAWQGGHHLNLKLCVQTTRQSDKKHIINAYDTGVTDSEGYRLIRLCHHLNGIKPTIWSPPLYASFPLPETEETVNDVRLIYTDEDGQTKIITVDD